MKAAGPLIVGFADDAGKYLDDSRPVVEAPADDGEEGLSSTPSVALGALTQGEFYDELRASGATANRITVLWSPARPLEIPQRARLDAAVFAATARGVEVMLGVRGATAGALTASPARRRLFASFLATLARAYPQVRSFVVGNEPNQPRFWQPQFRGRRPVAGAAYERVLALAYDALKRVRPSIQVVAAGISSRGNDDPAALENRSTSPVRFIRDLGAAYRTSGRTRPIMDALGFHPYPRSSTDSLRRPLRLA